MLCFLVSLVLQFFAVSLDVILVLFRLILVFPLCTSVSTHFFPAICVDHICCGIMSIACLSVE